MATPTGGQPFDPDQPAQDVLPGTLKREYPGDLLGHSLNDIKDLLKTATGAEKRKLQKAKKLLEQQQRLMSD
jgi:hypothetical protein